MADTVASQLIENGFRWWTYQFTNLSDGTGESAVVKVDPTSTGPLGVAIAGNTLYPGSHIKIREIEYDVKGMTLEMLWDATADQKFAVLGGYGRLKFDRFGGLVPYSAGALIPGATGKIKFTTTGQVSGGNYTVTMRGVKGLAQ